MLRGIGAVVLYLIAVIAVTAACITFLDSEGTSEQTQRRLIAFGFVFVAMLLWIGAGAVVRRPMFSIGRVIVLLAIGFVGVVAAENLLAASSRSRVKRTLADIRSIGTAVDAYATDNKVYPTAANIDELGKQLSPTYIKSFPRTDGWGFPLKYEHSGNDFWIGSAGKYGEWQHKHLAQYTAGKNRSAEDDIVLMDETFIRYLP